MGGRGNPDIIMVVLDRQTVRLCVRVKQGPTLVNLWA